MKNGLIVKLMLLLMAASGFACAPANAAEAAKPDAVHASTVGGTPVLEVPEWFFDFGDVEEGTKYLHTFIIRNIGTGVLEITKVQPG